MTPEEILNLNFTNMRKKFVELSLDQDKWYQVKNVFDPNYSPFKDHKGFANARAIINAIETQFEENDYYATPRSPNELRNQPDEEEIALAKLKRAKGCFE